MLPRNRQGRLPSTSGRRVLAAWRWLASTPRSTRSFRPSRLPHRTCFFQISHDLAEIGLQSGGYTGFGAGGIQAAQQLAVGLGLYDEEGVKAVAGNELLTSIQNRMALMTRNPDSGMGMPGAVSDRDIAFLKAANIGLDQTPEGNRLMLEVGRRLEERKIDIANLYDQWLDGDLDGKPHGVEERGFAKAARNWAKENPLFEDLKATSAAANLPPAPEGVDAEDWKYYTPEQIKLYYPDYKP